jgi:hypothetical protein
MCQDYFPGLPRGLMVDWRFNCSETRWTQVSLPNGEPRLPLMRTALSSTAVSGVLARSTPRGARERGQTESRCGTRSGSSSHRFGESHLQSLALLTRPAHNESCHSGFRAFHSTHSLLKTPAGRAQACIGSFSPLGEKVPEGRMRGKPSPGTTLSFPLPANLEICPTHPTLSPSPRPSPTVTRVLLIACRLVGEGDTCGGAANCIVQHGRHES